MKRIVESRHGPEVKIVDTQVPCCQHRIEFITAVKPNHVAGRHRPKPTITARLSKDVAIVRHRVLVKIDLICYCIRSNWPAIRQNIRVFPHRRSVIVNHPIGCRSKPHVGIVERAHAERRKNDRNGKQHSDHFMIVCNLPKPDTQPSTKALNGKPALLTTPCNCRIIDEDKGASGFLVGSAVFKAVEAAHGVAWWVRFPSAPVYKPIVFYNCDFETFIPTLNVQSGSPYKTLRPEPKWLAKNEKANHQSSFAIQMMVEKSAQRRFKSDQSGFRIRTARDRRSRRAFAAKPSPTNDRHRPSTT